MSEQTETPNTDPTPEEQASQAAITEFQTEVSNLKAELAEDSPAPEGETNEVN